MDNNMMLVARRNRAEKLYMAFFEDAALARLRGEYEEAKKCVSMGMKFMEMANNLSDQINKTCYFNKEEAK